MPQPLLSGEVVGDQPQWDEDRVLELEGRVSDLERRLDTVKRDAVVIVLNLLAKSMKRVAAGEFDIDEVATATSSPSKWDAIKKRLPPRQSEAIDIFLAQGSLRRTQLAAAMKMDYSNCTKNVIAVLVRQGLLIESGGMLSLKEL
jgi:hypothetical protein